MKTARIPLTKDQLKRIQGGGIVLIRLPDAHISLSLKEEAKKPSRFEEIMEKSNQMLDAIDDFFTP